MAPELLKNLQARSPAIRERWATLLRAAPVRGPLANPDALVHLIPTSLESIFADLGKRSRVPVSLMAARSRLPACHCGHNPYLAYFVAGERALAEVAEALQAEQPTDARRASDLAKLVFVVRRHARSEIDTFCGICAHRAVAPHCRHAVLTH